MHRDSQETTVTWGTNEDLVYIYTAVPKHQRKLLSREGVLRVDEFNFTVPKPLFDPLSGFKRRSNPMSDEQRAAAAERFRQYREAQNAN